MRRGSYFIFTIFERGQRKQNGRDLGKKKSKNGKK